MNSAPPREFSRLTQPAQDFRPQYDATLANIVRVIWRRKWLIATVAAACVTGAVGIASLMDKSYVGEALIQLTFDGEGSANASPQQAANTAVEATSIVEGEAEIIRSRAIARRVASTLWAADDPAQGATSPRLSTNRNATKSDDAIDANSVPPSYLGALAQKLRQGLASPPVSALDREVLALQTNLSVRNDSKSYLIRIGYTASDPVRAAMIANAFAETYLQSRVEVSVNSARRTSEWLASQITAAKDAVAEADRQVSDARQANNLRGSADIGNAQAVDKQLADLVGQLSGVRLDRLNLEARLARLRDAVASGHTPSILDLAGSTDAPRLVEAEVTSRQEATRLASTLGEKHPMVARANQALQNARDQLGSAITSAIGVTEADVASARSSEDNLAQRLNDAKHAALESQAAFKQLSQLESEAETARGGLLRLQESYRQALALADLKPIGAKLASPAESWAMPASPKMSLVALMSGIVGLGAGLGLVFLLEARDHGFRSAQQLAAELGARCIGIIPTIDFRLGGASRRLREEALKSLVIKAGLTRRLGENTIVVVTSAVPAEGKTELVRDLAQTLAALDQRVLTIENVIRRPSDRGPESQGTTVAGGNNQTALTMRAQNAGAKIAGYYRASTDLRGVFESHDHLQAWLEANGAHFDVVIVEAPPILTNADSLLLTRVADLVLFAVKWNATPKAAVSSAYAQLAWPKVETAVVLNQVDLSRHKALGLKDNLYFHRRYLGRRASKPSSKFHAEAL